MAYIASVADQHSSPVIDSSKGYPHKHHPITGVKIYVNLSEAEISRLTDFLEPRGTASRLGRLLGPGWTYSRLTATLIGSFNLDNNPWDRKTIDAIVNQALRHVNAQISKLSS